MKDWRREKERAVGRDNEERTGEVREVEVSRKAHERPRLAAVRKLQLTKSY